MRKSIALMTGLVVAGLAMPAAATSANQDCKSAQRFGDQNLIKRYCNGGTTQSPETQPPGTQPPPVGDIPSPPPSVGGSPPSGGTATDEIDSPRGSFVQSCKDTQQDGWVVTSNCRTISGEQSQTKMNFKNCPNHSLTNINGNLVCGP